MNQVIPEAPPDFYRARIVDRPDGVYWRPKGAMREYGPFATFLEAVEDMEVATDSAPEPGESLQEAEAEIGIAEWIDPETGAPAEEARARLEDH